MPVFLPFKRKSDKPSGRRLLGMSDGDTPRIELPNHMANIDTPEMAACATRPDTGRYGFCNAPLPDQLWVAIEVLEQARIDVGFA